MPKIIHNNVTIFIRWSKESDRRILSAGKLYGHWRIFHRKNGNYERVWIIDWKNALESGALKNLPNVALNKISKRHSHLKHLLNSDPIQIKKKKKQDNKKYAKKKKVKNTSFDTRITIWKNLPESIRKNFGYKPRSIWTEKQKKLLLKIASKYKNKLSIKWVLLMQDPRVLQLPAKYHNNLCALRKYYWCVARTDRKSRKFVRKHREDALRWKSENLERYYENQHRRINLIRKTVNTFLSNKIGIIK